jgi:hypothetical protein
LTNTWATVSDQAPEFGEEEMKEEGAMNLEDPEDRQSGLFEEDSDEGGASSDEEKGRGGAATGKKRRRSAVSNVGAILELACLSHTLHARFHGAQGLYAWPTQTMQTGVKREAFDDLIPDYAEEDESDEDDDDDDDDDGDSDTDSKRPRL